MKNIQIKFFTSEEAVNGWLSSFRGEVLDIKMQSEVVDVKKRDDNITSHWHHQFMIIYQA